VRAATSDSLLSLKPEVAANQHSLSVHEAKWRSTAQPSNVPDKSKSGQRLGQDEGVSSQNLAREKGRSKIMPLLQILEVLIVVGVLLWLVNRFIPMQGSIKSILNGVVVIAVVLWLLNVFGLFHSLSRMHIGTLLIP
jgi:hypothetical protein